MTALVDAFRAVDGDLRLVAMLDSTDWHMEYLRDDLEGTYTADDLDRAYQNLLANQVSSDDFSRVHQTGNLVGQLYYFEKTLSFQFPASRYEGVFVSYDQAEDFPVLEVFEAAQSLPAIGSTSERSDTD